MENILFRIKNLFGSILKTPTKNQRFYQHLYRESKLREIIHTKDINLEEAFTFVENQAEDLIHVDQMISFSLCVNDKKMYVLLTPTPSGGIYISVYDRDIKKQSNHILCM